MTPIVMEDTDNLRRKVYVRRPSGRMNYRRPKWIAKWNGWFARIDNGWLEITGRDGGFLKVDSE